MKKTLLTAALIIVVAAGIGGCGKKQPEKAKTVQAPAEVKAAPLQTVTQEVTKTVDTISTTTNAAAGKAKKDAKARIEKLNKALQDKK